MILKLHGPLSDYGTSCGFFIIVVENLSFAYHSEIWYTQCLKSSLYLTDDFKIDLT